MTFLTTRRAVLTLAAGLTLTTAFASPSFAATNLSFLVDNAPSTVAWAEQLKKDFEAANPDITIDIEQRPGGADGDNRVKTKLATGDMSDVFNYNSG